MKIEQLVSKKGYKVSKNGVLYNPLGKEIGHMKGAYQVSKHRVDKRFVFCKTHRLQAYQKFGDKLYEKGLMVRHLDGNPLNNSWSNIELGTNRQNQMDIPKEKRVERAIKATSFVRKYDKEEVRKFHFKSMSYKKTMQQFNISSKGTLHYILKN